MIKRFFDFFISLVLLIILIIPMLFIALVIRMTSRGPFLFKQERIGQNKEPFTLYKFRTMEAFEDHSVFHIEEVKKQVFAPYARRSQQVKFDGDERRKVIHKFESDKITWMGRFLRKTSLDELPQLFNVLKGEMSLVGPRPPIRYELGFHTQDQLRRLDVKPGITGLWQISGRSHMNYKEMIIKDLEYVEKQSFILDIQILYKTFFQVLHFGKTS